MLTRPLDSWDSKSLFKGWFHCFTRMPEKRVLSEDKERAFTKKKTLGKQNRINNNFICTCLCFLKKR